MNALPMSLPINILIVDDHKLIAEAWSAIINTEIDLKVVGISGCRNESVQLALNLRPDVVLMDINIHNGNGFDACLAITNQLPKVKVIGLSIHDDLSLVKKMITSGAAGYLTKNCSSLELINAIRTVCKGEQYLSNDITEKYTKSFFVPSSESQELTEREIEIIPFIAQGMTSKEIGNTLHLSPRTVDTHRHNIIRKLNLANSADLSRWAKEKGYI